MTYLRQRSAAPPTFDSLRASCRQNTPLVASAWRLARARASSSPLARPRTDLPRTLSSKRSRASLQGLTEGFALDLASRVNLRLPEVLDTEHWDSSLTDAKAGLIRGLAVECLTERVARSAMVTEAYVYEMKDASATGSMIGTNGGSLLSKPKSGW